MAAQPIDPILYELQAEQAYSLGLAARRMEAAIAALRAWDAGERPADTSRDDLFAEAAERVWYYVVQRDALGWHDHQHALAVYDVPAEVIALMGPRKTR